MTNTTTFGAELRRRRLALGLSQGKLAKALGVPTVTLQRWEWGRNHPTHWTMINAALQRIEQQSPKAGRG